MKNKIIITVIMILVVVSLGFNLYFLVWQNVEQKIMQKGAASVLKLILDQVKQTGQIQIEDLILVPKTESPAAQPAETEK